MAEWSWVKKKCSCPHISVIVCVCVLLGWQPADSQRSETSVCWTDFSTGCREKHLWHHGNAVQRWKDKTRWCKTTSNVCYRLIMVFLPFVFVLLTDNRLESLIQKADQVLNSLSQSSGEADPGECRTQPMTQCFRPLLFRTRSVFGCSLFSTRFSGRMYNWSHLLIIIW